MNSFDGAIKTKNSGAANTDIIDNYFRGTVSTCEFQIAIALIQSHPKYQSVLTDISGYIDELKTENEDFPLDCNKTA